MYGVLGMLFDLFRGNGFDFGAFFAYVIASLVIIMLILPLHELAHGFIADKLGDPTARYMRRLTLNPFAHIDWLGAASIMLFGFGWAKPVPVNMRNLNRPKRDMAIVALAGPLSNLIAAFIGMGLLFFCVKFGSPLVNSQAARYILEFIVNFFAFFLQVNITLAVFNLIPCPPLDGSKILMAFLPNRIYYRIMQFERYFGFILLLLILSDVLDPILIGATSKITGWFFDFYNMIFNLI